MEVRGPASSYARTWDAAGWPSLTESAKGMAQGAATRDATTMSMLKMSAEIMAQGAATWDATYNVPPISANLSCKQERSAATHNTFIILCNMATISNGRERRALPTSSENDNGKQFHAISQYCFEKATVELITENIDRNVQKLAVKWPHASLKLGNNQV